MKIIPKCLYSKEILSLIKYLIDDHNVKDFDLIDDIQKDQLIAHAMKELQYDIDIVLSHDSNKFLSRYLLSHSYDDYCDFNISVKNDTYEHFSPYFNFMIQEKIDELNWRKQA